MLLVLSDRRRTGALNWATGETVAIKEIQLSNIPKSEIGQIMVSMSNSAVYPLVAKSSSVRNRSAQEPDCTSY